MHAGSQFLLLMWIHEFVRDLVVDHMEDPKARDRRCHDHIEKQFAAARKLYAPSA